MQRFPKFAYFVSKIVYLALCLILLRSQPTKGSSSSFSVSLSRLVTAGMVRRAGGDEGGLDGATGAGAAAPLLRLSGGMG